MITLVEKFGYKLGGFISDKDFLTSCENSGTQLGLAILVRKYSPFVRDCLGNNGNKDSKHVIYTGPVKVSKIYDLLCLDDVLAITLRDQTEYFAPPIPIQLVTERYDPDELLKG